MDNLSEIAKEGLGWAVSVVEAGVIVFLFRAYISEKDKRYEDAIQEKQAAVIARDAAVASQGANAEAMSLVYSKLKGEKERV